MRAPGSRPAAPCAALSRRGCRRSGHDRHLHDRLRVASPCRSGRPAASSAPSSATAALMPGSSEAIRFGAWSITTSRPSASRTVCGIGRQRAGRLVLEAAPGCKQGEREQRVEGAERHGRRLYCSVVRHRSWLFWAFLAVLVVGLALYAPAELARRATAPDEPVSFLSQPLQGWRFLLTAARERPDAIAGTPPRAREIALRALRRRPAAAVRGRACCGFPAESVQPDHLAGEQAGGDELAASVEGDGTLGAGRSRGHRRADRLLLGNGDLRRPTGWTITGQRLRSLAGRCWRSWVLDRVLIRYGRRFTERLPVADRAMLETRYRLLRRVVSAVVLFLGSSPCCSASPPRAPTRRPCSPPRR